MIDKQKEFLLDFTNRQKRVVAYYTYPTGYSDNSILAYTSDRGDQVPDPLLKTTVDLFLALAQHLAGKGNDNKTAVKVEVHGRKDPVYLHRMDSQWIITDGAPTLRSGAEEIIVKSNRIE